MHDVIAAITTDPSRTRSVSGGPFGTGAAVTPSGSIPPSSSSRDTSPSAVTSLELRSARCSQTLVNDSHTPGNATRSCGRLGPATLGTTLARSSSTISLNVGIGESSVRNMPCSFA